MVQSSCSVLYIFKAEDFTCSHLFKGKKGDCGQPGTCGFRGTNGKTGNCGNPGPAGDCGAEVSHLKVVVKNIVLIRIALKK